MIGKMMELWRKWFGKETLPVVENDKVTAPEKKESRTRKSTLLDDLEGYLFARYDFRFNVLLPLFPIAGGGGRGKTAFAHRDFLPFAEEVSCRFPWEQCQPDGKAVDLVGSGAYTLEIWQCL